MLSPCMGPQHGVVETFPPCLETLLHGLCRLIEAVSFLVLTLSTQCLAQIE